MKTKLLILLLFSFIIWTNSSAQSIESEGYLMIQYMQPVGAKTIINVVSPNGNSEQIELQKIPAMSFSVENIKRIISSNQAQLLNVLESYRKKNYEVISVTSELQGYVTNYLLRKKITL